MTASVSLAALAGCVLLPAVAGPAVAATTPATGTAQSGFTLAKIVSGATFASVGVVSLDAAGLAAPSASISLTPVDSSLTGPVGALTVTPANSPQSTGGQSASVIAGPVAVGTLTAPAFTASASKAATLAMSLVSANGLAVKLIGLPLSVTSVVFNDSARMASLGASAGKTLSIGSLGLPTLAALLAAFGVNGSVLSNLPIAGLQSLATTVAGVVGGAQGSAVTAANTAVTQADTSWTTADQAVATASQQLANALAVLNNNLGNPVIAAAITATGLSTPVTPSEFANASATIQSTIETALNTFQAGAGTALTTATAAYIAAVQAANQALTTLRGDLTALAGSLLNALDTPIAALTGIKVSTLASTGSAPAASGTATVAGVDVLGVATQVGSLATTLTATVGKILGALHSAFAGIDLKAPTITLAQVTKSATTVSGVQKATVTVVPVGVTLPAESVDLAGLTNGLPVSVPLVLGPSAAPRATALTSTPAVTLSVATFGDAATYTPAVSTPQGSTGTPTGAPTGTPPATHPGSLAFTGTPVALSVSGLLVLLAGLGLARLRRRTAAG